MANRFKVVVHQSMSQQMNFLQKNFKYVKQAFGSFIDAINEGQMLYLRSLSADKPSDEPADIKSDFPSIAEDFRLPHYLTMVSENAHSTPLRISGPVNMWLHYDVGSWIPDQIVQTKTDIHR